MAYKTLTGWSQCGKDLGEYLEVGDIVDEGIVDHFMNILPPRTFEPDLIQMGDPYDENDQGFTYHTIQLMHGAWFFTGIRNRGHRVSPEVL